MGYEMKHSKTPSAWAKLRAHAYRYGGITIVAIMALAWLDILSNGLAVSAIALLIPLVLAVNIPHIWAILKGDQRQQQIEKQAWTATTEPFLIGFRLARQFWTADRNHPLREVGAIGLDLTRTNNRASGRQSGAQGQGHGGHRKPASSGSDDDSDGDEPPANLPILWTIHDLADTLAVSAKTLQNQPPHHLPPAIRIPGCRGPRYRLQDVLAWLDGFVAKHRPAAKLKKNIGRPRIASGAQIAAIRGKGV